MTKEAKIPGGKEPTKYPWVLSIEKGMGMVSHGIIELSFTHHLRAKAIPRKCLSHWRRTVTTAAVTDECWRQGDERAEQSRVGAKGSGEL
jgi:hypothetical protein